MPERVVYWRAFADFSSLRAESAKTKQSIKELREEARNTTSANDDLAKSEDRLATKTNTTGNKVASVSERMAVARERAAEASHHQIAASDGATEASAREVAAAARSTQMAAAERKARAETETATNSLATARERAAHATDRVNTADAEAQRLMTDQTATAKKLADAQHELTTARNLETRALQKVRDEQSKVSEAEAKEHKLIADNRLTVAKAAADFVEAEQKKAAAIEASNRRQANALEVQNRRAQNFAAEEAARTTRRIEQERRAAEKSDVIAKAAADRELQRNRTLTSEIQRLANARAANAALIPTATPNLGQRSSLTNAVENAQRASASVPQTKRTYSQVTAVNALERAQENLKNANAGVVTSYEKLNTAEQRHAIAEANLVSISDELTSAERELVQTIAAHGEGSDRANVADNRRLQLRSELEKAYNAEREAQNAVTSSMRGAEGAVRRVEAADTRLEGATRRVDQAFRTAGGGGSIFGRILSSLYGGFEKADGAVSSFASGLRAIRIPALIGAVVLLVEALSTLTSGLFSLGSAIAPAIGGLAAAIPVAFSLGGAFLSLKAAFSGIGGALKAYSAAQTKASVGGTKAANTAANNADAVKNAQESLNDARAQVGITAQQGARQVEDASAAIVNAQQNEIDAQHNLNDARKAAKQNLIDLKNAAIDAALAERGAVLDLADAQAALIRANNDPNASRSDRERAQLQVDSAQQSSVEATQTNTQAQTANLTGQAAGVEGNSDVIAAKKQVADANASLSKSERDFRDTLAESSRSNAKAIQAVTRAERDLVKAKRADANAGGAAATAADTYQAKLAALSPAARKFTEHLIGMKKYWTDLKKTAADNLFPGLTKGVDKLPKLFPVIKSTVAGISKTLGDMGNQFATLFTTPRWISAFKQLGAASSPILKTMGNALANIMDALRSVAVAAIPMTKALTHGFERWTKSIAKSADAAQKSGRMGKFFEHTQQVLHTIGQILKNLFVGFYNVGKAAMGPGTDMLNTMSDVVKKWRDWTGSKEGQAKLHKFFIGVRENMKVIDHYIGKIVKGFLGLGDNKNFKPIMAGFADIGKSISGAFGGKDGKGITKTFADLLHTIARTIRELTSNSNGLGVFLKTLGIMLDLFNKILSLPGVGPALGAIFAAFAAFKALKFLGITGGIRGIASAIRDFTAASREAGGTGALVKGKVNQVSGEVKAAGAATMRTGRAVASAPGRAARVVTGSNTAAVARGLNATEENANRVRPGPTVTSRPTRRPMPGPGNTPEPTRREAAAQRAARAAAGVGPSGEPIVAGGALGRRAAAIQRAESASTGSSGSTPVVLGGAPESARSVAARRRETARKFGPPSAKARRAAATGPLAARAAALEGPTFSHGGLPEGTTLNDIDLERRGTQQGRRNKGNYGGFYMGDNEDPRSKDWVEGYAKKRTGVVHDITMKPEASIGKAEEIWPTKSNIDRLTPEDRAHARSLGHDVISGKDALGRSQHVLLNKDAVANVAERKIAPPASTSVSLTAPAPAAKAPAQVPAWIRPDGTIYDSSHPRNRKQATPEDIQAFNNHPGNVNVPFTGAQPTSPVDETTSRLIAGTDNRLGLGRPTPVEEPTPRRQTRRARAAGAVRRRMGRMREEGNDAGFMRIPGSSRRSRRAATRLSGVTSAAGAISGATGSDDDSSLEDTVSDLADSLGGNDDEEEGGSRRSRRGERRAERRATREPTRRGRMRARVGRVGGRMSRMNSRMGGGAAAAAGGVAGIGISMLGDAINDGKGGARQAVGGALSGAGMGASLGAAAGPMGMLAGAAIGGVIGLFQNSKIGGVIKKWISNTVMPALKALPENLVKWGKDLLGWIEWPFKQMNEIANKYVGPLYNYIKVIFSSIGSFFAATFTFWKTIFMAAIRIIKDIFTGNFGDIWKQIKVIFGAIGTYLGSMLNILKNLFLAAWGYIKWAVMTPVNAIWKGIKFVLGAIGDYIKLQWNILKTVTMAAWNLIKGYIVNPITNAFHAVKTAVGVVIDWLSRQWNGLWTTAKSLFGKIGTAISTPFVKAGEAIGDAFDAVKKGLVGAINWIISNILNKMIHAVNAVITKLGVHKIEDVPLIGAGGGGKPAVGGAAQHNAVNSLAEGGTLPGYSPGSDTRTFQDQHGYRIRLSGGEGILTPETTRALGGKPAVDALNAQHSPRLRSKPRFKAALRSVGMGGFADGGVPGGTSIGGKVVGGLGSTLSNIGSAVGSIGGDVSKAWQKLRDAGAWATVQGLKAAESPIRALVNKIPVSLLRKMTNGMFDTVNSAAYNFIAGHKQKDSGEANEVPSGQHAALIKQALALNKVADTSANESDVNYIVTRESGWNANAQNNYDVNAKNGIPSQGLTQIIPPNFESYHVAGTADNIRDPLANLAAGVNYMVKRYGSVADAQNYWEGHHYYKDGGQVENFHEGGVVKGKTNSKGAPYGLGATSTSSAISGLYGQAGIGFPDRSFKWGPSLTAAYRKRLAGVNKATDVKTNIHPRTENLIAANDVYTPSTMAYVDRTDPKSYNALWEHTPRGHSAGWPNKYHLNPLAPILSYQGSPSTWENYRKNKDAAQWAHFAAEDNAKIAKKDKKVTTSHKGFQNLEQVKNFIHNADSKKYVYGAVGPNTYDCSGLVGEVWARLTGHPSYHRYFSTMNEGSNKFFKPGKGDGVFEVGYSNNSREQHTAGSLDGLKFEARSTNDGIIVGNKARNPGSFDHVVHLPAQNIKGLTAAKNDKLTVADEKKKHPRVVRQQAVEDAQWKHSMAILKNATTMQKNRVMALRKDLNIPQSTSNGGMWNNDITGPMDHAAAHALGIEHPADWPHPWSGPVSAVESAVADSNRSNALNTEWFGDLNTIAAWGMEPLLNYLMSKGITDGLEIARSSVKDKKTAQQLNDSLQAGLVAQGATGDDQSLILKIIAKLGSGTAAKPYGLRDVSADLNVADYVPVNLFDKMTKQLATLAPALTARYKGDIGHFREGTFYAATGGMVPGDKGSPNKDSVHAMLVPGEGVLTRKAMSLIGGEAGLNQLNNTQAFADGGMVKSLSFSPDFGGLSIGSATMKASTGTTVKTDNSRTQTESNVTYHTEIINPTGENSVYSFNKNLRKQAILGTAPGGR